MTSKNMFELLSTYHIYVTLFQILCCRNWSSLVPFPQFHWHTVYIETEVRRGLFRCLTLRNIKMADKVRDPVKYELHVPKVSYLTTGDCHQITHVYFFLYIFSVQFVSFKTILKSAE